jgi:hypothetical protein
MGVRGRALRDVWEPKKIIGNRPTLALQPQPIHTDTLGHWTELLDHARLEHSKGSTEQLAILIVELESELADRADS